MVQLTLHNSLSRSREPFTPLDASHLRMYVCGPTVYARPHIGNARSVVVYDVFYRLLKQLYPTVTYARNITDVDDKINAAAVERGIPIHEITAEVTQQFHDDMDALHCLRPDMEPRATGHIADIITMIKKLIDNGHAYAEQGHVLFDVTNYDAYGHLSRRSTEDMIAGARVEVAPYKRNPGDFVLWKPPLASDDASSVFDSPWGKGRPGWHIECSAMATRHLGETFDIHGGGADLMFPHHENEIAQSCCANPGSAFARYWVHNGFLTVDGEKMSKSLGNFITVKDLLDQGVDGEVIRFALLSTHYRKPLDWTDKLLSDAKKQLDGFYRAMQSVLQKDTVPDEYIALLADDLNVPEAIGFLHQAPPEQLKTLGDILGILQQDPEHWFKGEGDESIDALVAQRITAKQARDWAEADRIRDTLKAQGILLEDRPDGTTDWRRG